MKYIIKNTKKGNKMNEQGLFEIMKKLNAWHNFKMGGVNMTPEKLREFRLEIINLAGLNTDKIIELADEIDGCCFEIAQNKTITREHLEQENNAIDHCSTSLRALVENIGE